MPVKECSWVEWYNALCKPVEWPVEITAEFEEVDNWMFWWSIQDAIR